MFSHCQFHVFVSMGTLKSDLLSQSTTCGTKWTTVYLQYYAGLIDTCGN